MTRQTQQGKPGEAGPHEGLDAREKGRSDGLIVTIIQNLSLSHDFFF